MKHFAFFQLLLIILFRITGNIVSAQQAQATMSLSKYMNPYLQNMKTNSVYVNWLTSAQTTSVSVDYGLTSALGTNKTGTCSAISSSNNYCTVQLTGLMANTLYDYKCNSGTGSTARSAPPPQTT